jgi:hypothetical protein
MCFHFIYLVCAPLLFCFVLELDAKGEDLAIRDEATAIEVATCITGLKADEKTNAVQVTISDEDIPFLGRSIKGDEGWSVSMEYTTPTNTNSAKGVLRKFNILLDAKSGKLIKVYSRLTDSQGQLMEDFTSDQQANKFNGFKFKGLPSSLPQVSLLKAIDKIWSQKDSVEIVAYYVMGPPIPNPQQSSKWDEKLLGITLPSNAGVTSRDKAYWVIVTRNPPVISEDRHILHIPPNDNAVESSEESKRTYHIDRSQTVNIFDAAIGDTIECFPL